VSTSHQTPSPSRTVRRFALAVLAWSLVAGPAAAQTYDAESRAALVHALSEKLESTYVFPDKAAECSARLDEALQAGELDVTTPDALAALLTELLQGVTADKHLRVRVMDGGPPPEEPTAEELERWQRSQWLRGRTENFGFENVLRVPGNIGVLDLRSFQSPEHARGTAMAAMTFLANCDALIVDLRRNGGGDPEMVQLLCSYLFDEPTHLNSLYWRETDETQEFWTLDEEALPGPRMPDVPVFVLTSSYTFSGAEEFTYNLKTRGRATIVGETTGGGAHPGGTVPIDDHIGAFIPVGRAINPVTGTNWEGTGVAPDVACPSGKAMDEALALAREAAREHADRMERE